MQNQLFFFFPILRYPTIWGLHGSTPLADPFNSYNAIISTKNHIKMHQVYLSFVATQFLLFLFFWITKLSNFICIDIYAYVFLNIYIYILFLCQNCLFKIQKIQLHKKIYKYLATTIKVKKKLRINLPYEYGEM